MKEIIMIKDDKFKTIKTLVIFHFAVNFCILVVFFIYYEVSV
jgi:hypothetical protein